MHKSPKKKILQILFIPDNQNALPKNFRISYSALAFLGVVASLAAAAILVGLITYGHLLQVALEKKDLEKDYLALREQLQLTYQLQAQMDSLRTYKELVQNSLQGYIKFADRADEELVADAQFVENSRGYYSIFKNIPLHTPVSGFISQEYNWPNHIGIDIVAPLGTPIQAAADGVVIFDGWTNKNGHMLIIYHSGGYITKYGHNARNLVTVNQKISQGDVIAILGNSGESSSGPHLHFEVWQKEKPINPRVLISDLEKENTGE